MIKYLWAPLSQTWPRGWEDRIETYACWQIYSRFPQFIEQQVGWDLHQQVSGNSSVSAFPLLPSLLDPITTYPTNKILTAVEYSTLERWRSASRPASLAAAMLFLFSCRRVSVFLRSNAIPFPVWPSSQEHMILFICHLQSSKFDTKNTISQRPTTLPIPTPTNSPQE